MSDSLWSGTCLSIVVATALIGLSRECCAQSGIDSPYAFALPIQQRGCGGFCTEGDSMYLFEYGGRRLHVVERGRLREVENVAGMYVVDAAVIGGNPFYCSRDRLFRKIGGNVKLNPVGNTEALVSVTADDRQIYLLDAAPKSTIVVLNRGNGKEQRRIKYDGHNPTDLAVSDGHLWVMDQGDRCVHRVDPRTGATTLRIQAGPGIKSGTHGLMVRGDDLYVHEADFARLRRLDWREDESTVWSWSRKLKMTFVQESRNEHDRADSIVDFDVPIPQTRATQTVGKVEWSQAPSRVYADEFGQPIARFDEIHVKPKGEHVLTYTVEVEVRAVQYDPPRAPLTTLDDIDPEIRRTFLASNSLYQMGNPAIQAAARQARKNRQGVEANDVRTLIENIADYVAAGVSYKMDDSWNSAEKVLASKSGSCSEYSFLFSALCRLNKIPTRLVGGVEFGDYLVSHETIGFHRWTEVWFPELGWIPVDVTKIDGAEGSYDYEFLFGTPGYFIVLSQGDFDEKALGMTYAIRRAYRGGRRTRKTFVRIDPIKYDGEKIQTLTK